MKEAFNKGRPLMIRLFQVPSSLPGTPNPSPFCVKLECALRLGNIPYEVGEVINPNAGPKGKVPFVEIDGERIGDSTLILDRLRLHRGLNLDRNLDTRTRAASHALQRMIEERLYWVMVNSRWIEPDNWVKIRELFFSSMPWTLRGFIARVARRSVRGQIMGHGIGVHSRDEIYMLGRADLQALGDSLGGRSFLFGEQPTLADATMFGLLVNIVGPDIESPLKTAALAHPNLVAHTERMGEIFASMRQPRQLKAA